MMKKKSIINGMAHLTAGALLGCAFMLAGCEGESESHIYDGHDFGTNNPNVFVAFGDSITYGVGEGIMTNYPTKLGNLLGKPVYNEGYPGAESFVGAAMVNYILDGYKPGFLLILFGANDLIMGYGEDEAIGNLQYICQAAINNKTIPVIATLTPVFGEHKMIASGVSRLNILIRQMAIDMNVALVDLDAAFMWNPVYMQSDGLHPNDQGNDLMAVTFYNVVK